MPIVRYSKEAWTEWVLTIGLATLAKMAFDGSDRGYFHTDPWFASWTEAQWLQHFQAEGVESIVERILKRQTALILHEEQLWKARGWLTPDELTQKKEEARWKARGWVNYSEVQVTREQWNTWLNMESTADNDEATMHDSSGNEDDIEPGEITAIAYIGSGTSTQDILYESVTCLGQPKRVYFQNRAKYDHAKTEGRIPAGAIIFIAGTQCNRADL